MNDEFLKDLEGSGRSLILIYYPGIHLEVQKKTIKKSQSVQPVSGSSFESWTSRMDIMGHG
jgi:hypothetical protein